MSVVIVVSAVLLSVICFGTPVPIRGAHLILATATITNDFLPIHDSSLTFRLLVTSGPSRHDQA